MTLKRKKFSPLHLVPSELGILFFKPLLFPLSLSGFICKGYHSHHYFINLLQYKRIYLQQEKTQHFMSVGGVKTERANKILHMLRETSLYTTKDFK